MLAMIAFPFQLAFVRPWATARSCALIVLVSILITFFAAQFWPSLETVDPASVGGYALILLALGAGSTSLMACAMAPLVATSLRNLGLRDRPIGLIDVLLFATATVLITMGWGLIVGLARRTYVVARFAVEASMNGEAPIVYWFDALLVLIIVLSAFLYARLWLAGPAALLDRSLGFRTSWVSTRNKLWRSFAYAAPLMLLASGIRELVSAFGGTTSIADFASDSRDLFEPRAFFGLVGIALVDALIWAFTAAATVFAFAKITDRLLPEQTSA